MLLVGWQKVHPAYKSSATTVSKTVLLGTNLSYFLLLWLPFCIKHTLWATKCRPCVPKLLYSKNKCGKFLRLTVYSSISTFFFPPTTPVRQGMDQPCTKFQKLLQQNCFLSPNQKHQSTECCILYNTPVIMQCNFNPPCGYLTVLYHRHWDDRVINSLKKLI